MREEIVKAYDILIEAQRNADSKANLFIVLISAVIAFVSDIPVTIYSQESLEVYQFLFLLLILPLLLFVLSLIPIYSDTFNLKRKKEEHELNLFYWNSIQQYKTFSDFEKHYVEVYGILNTKAELDMLKQVYVNACILQNKVLIHRHAFISLGHLLLLFFVGLIGMFWLQDNYTAGAILLLVFELVYLQYLYKYINKCTNFFRSTKKEKE